MTEALEQSQTEEFQNLHPKFKILETNLSECYDLLREREPASEGRQANINTELRSKVFKMLNDLGYLADKSNVELSVITCRSLLNKIRIIHEQIDNNSYWETASPEVYLKLYPEMLHVVSEKIHLKEQKAGISMCVQCKKPKKP